MARWRRKWDLDARTDGWSPIPTRVITNEEYLPLARTPEQARVAALLAETARRSARVVVQVHYHHRGTKPETDRTRLGLHFARKPIDKRVRAIPILNRTFTIPAGEARHEVKASWTLPPAWNLHAIAVTPHMHLLGREMKVTATYPDGTVRPLIYIDDWDFHWQGSYTFTQPVPLPGGTRIDVTAIYDNSPGNKRNPTSPPRAVGWGEGTTDEMCIAFLRVTVDAERLGVQPR